MLATLERNRVETETQAPTYVQPSYLTRTTTDDDDYDYNSGSSNNFGGYTQPTFSTYTNTSTDTEPAFEIETEYNQTSAQQEFRTVTPSMQTVERAQVFVEPQRAVKLSPRLKIMLTVFSLVFVMLVGLVVYNAVAITSATNSIAGKQVEVSMATQSINASIVEYNGLGTESYIEESARAIGFDYASAEAETQVAISRPVLDAVNTYQAPSNWFDKICEFFSSLF